MSQLPDNDLTPQPLNLTPEERAKLPLLPPLAPGEEIPDGWAVGRAPVFPDPPEGSVFVFGSNLAGIHGAGAAYDAYTKYGAVLGQGQGPQGRSYAIPTKDYDLRSLPLDRIQGYVSTFLHFAQTHAPVRFYVTRIGCGFAGYTDYDIAPMFATAPANCLLPEGWRT